MNIRTMSLSRRLLCLSFLVWMLLTAGFGKTSADCPDPLGGKCGEPGKDPITSVCGCADAVTSATPKDSICCAAHPLTITANRIEVTKVDLWAVRNKTAIKTLTITVCGDPEKIPNPFIIEEIGTKTAPGFCANEDVLPLDKSGKPFFISEPPSTGFNPSTEMEIRYTPTTASDTTRFLCLRGVRTIGSLICDCKGCNEIKLVGHVLSEALSLTISPDELKFFIEPNFPTLGRTVTVTLTAKGEDIRLTNFQFLDKSGVDLLNDVPFEVVGLPPSTILMKDKPFMFQIKLVELTRIGVSPFDGKVRITGEAEGSKDHIIIDVTIKLGVNFEAFAAPTLTEWGMIATAFLMLVVGTIFIIRNQKSWKQ
jgi:hypothetical protein